MKPKIHTLVIGHAFGQAAMLLALGTKGHRFALPNSRMKIYSPKVNRSSGSAIDMWIKVGSGANMRHRMVEGYGRCCCFVGALSVLKAVVLTFHPSWHALSPKTLK